MKLSWEHEGGKYIEHYTAELPKNAWETLLTPPFRPLHSVCIFASPSTIQTAKFLAVPRKNASTSGFNLTPPTSVNGQAWEGDKSTSHFLNSTSHTVGYMRPQCPVPGGLMTLFKNSPASLEPIQEEVFLRAYCQTSGKGRHWPGSP